MKQILSLLIILVLCRCSTMGRSVGLGVGVGAASGLATSQIAGYNAKGTVALTAGGAIIGGLTAAFLHKDPPEEPLPPVPINYLHKNPPPLRDAETDAIMVPDRIEGDRFIEHHRVFLIKKPSHWQLYPTTPDDKGKNKNEEDGDDGNNEKE